MIRNEPESVNMYKDKLYGIYRAIVEDNDDSQEWKDREWEGGTGRVRVRIVGLHTEMTTENDDEEGIPVNQLPWAEPAVPMIGGSVTGKGTWGIPQQGSHVFIFFEAGEVTQPRYFASSPAIQPKETDYNRDISDKKGFKDPDEKYPLNSLMDEPDMNRLMRSKDEYPRKTAWEALDVKLPYGGCLDTGLTKFDPPPHTYSYPEGITIEAENGQTLDFSKDSTLLYNDGSTYIVMKNGQIWMLGVTKQYPLMIVKNLNVLGDLNAEGNKHVIEGKDGVDVGSCLEPFVKLALCEFITDMVKAFNSHTHLGIPVDAPFQSLVGMGEGDDLSSLYCTKYLKGN